MDEISISPIIKIPIAVETVFVDSNDTHPFSQRLAYLRLSADRIPSHVYLTPQMGRAPPVAAA
jgi:hypothetical protein